MKKYLFLYLLVFAVHIISQTESKDSIYSGRVCIITLHNGFESDGIITRAGNDTIWFRNEFTEYRIPVKDISTIKSSGEENQNIPIERKTVESEECDVYLYSGSALYDVKLISDTDSGVIVQKNGRAKILGIEPIRKIEFSRTNFDKGILIGGGTGFALGLIFILMLPAHGEWSRPDFGQSVGFCLLTSLPTGLIGGLIGALITTDNKYYFPKGYSKLKSKRIKFIIEKHGN